MYKNTVTGEITGSWSVMQSWNVPKVTFLKDVETPMGSAEKEDNEKWAELNKPYEAHRIMRNKALGIAGY